MRKFMANIAATFYPEPSRFPPFGEPFEAYSAEELARRLFGENVTITENRDSMRPYGKGWWEVYTLAGKWVADIFPVN